MLYFSLPNFFEFKDVNLFMQGLARTRPEMFKEKIVFNSSNGAIPYLSWTGGCNSNVGFGIIYGSLLEFQSQFPMPVRINMANVLLEDYDFFDSLGQSVLSIFDNGSNVLEISSIPFMEKIKEKYPNYYFTLSKQADLISEFTPEVLNAIIDLDQFTLIGVPEKYNDNLEWLSSIKKRSLLEITINPICNYKKCSCGDVCLLKEHENQINYSNVQIRTNCSNKMAYYDLRNVPSIEELKRKYGKLGINHFTFSNNYGGITQESLLMFYFDYFLKPECVFEALNVWRSKSYA